MSRPGAYGVLLFLLSSPALAFGYLEHGFLSDRACHEAQRRLASEVTADEALVARYLALALMCPARWDRPYCADDYKQAEGSLHELSGPPRESGDHSVTLGDFAALADHLSDFGPVRGYPLASRRGLTRRLFGWLAAEPGDAGGVLADVGEDACETDDRVPWDDLEKDLSRRLSQAASEQGLPALSRDALVSRPRAPVPLGHVDPSGPYSFDNPQYLDLVLRNHDHFGARAYGSWLGFHSAAKEMAGRDCSALLALNAGALEDLADDLPGFEEVDWDELGDEALRVQGCRVLAERVRRRLVWWGGRADPALVAPVASALAALDEPLLERTTTALVGLLFEAGGLHFLQDNLAGGHLRTNREARGLAEARYDHDTDNAAGVLGVFSSAAGEHRFVAWGDAHLLGPMTAHDAACETLDAATPETVSACLLSWQRGLLTAATTASLLDWALGGPAATDRGPPEAPCATGGSNERYVCRWLPTRSTAPDGMGPGGPPPRTLGEGTLPVPPPPFAYESLIVSTAIDGAGDATQTGLRLEFLSELGGSRHWLSSVDFGLLTTHGSPSSPELLTELSYRFHFRWAARFLVYAGLGAHMGLRGYGRDVSWFAGVVPSAGLAALPEGWTRMPLEISLGYRPPVTLLDTRTGWSTESIRIEGHWIELGLGFAFM